jgi:hypothetical protein
MNPFYLHDKKKAVDAKFEAQKLAFGPYAFQAARTLRDTGILEMVSDSGEAGVEAPAVAAKLGLSEYAVATLLEFGLTMELVKLAADTEPLRYTLGKVGYFIQYDPMTRANMDFMHDVCYEGAFTLKESFLNGKPEGLKVFGKQWKTVYEALSKLPPQVQESWFAFDHFYSDVAFPEALPIVFRRQPKALFDIGGNTAKWALSCFKFDPEVKVTIIDLPGQAAMATKNIAEAGAAGRVGTFPCNVLDPSSVFPKGADAVWMSQFLDCFSLPEIEGILRKVGAAVGPECDVWVLEPFWDQQKYTAAAYSLHATSMYFCNMANGNSKMYRSTEMIEAIGRAGFRLEEAINGLGAHDYSLLRFRKGR